MNETKAADLWTIGEIARHLRTTPHRIAYLLQTRNIEPTAMFGRTNVYDSTAVALIERARADAERNKRRRGA